MLELTQKATKSTIASATASTAGLALAPERVRRVHACLHVRAPPCVGVQWCSGTPDGQSRDRSTVLRVLDCAQGLSRVLTPGLEGTVSDTHGDVLQFIHVGEEFSSSPSIVLRDSLKDQARNFFGLFHKDRVRELSRHKRQPMMVHSRARRQAAISIGGNHNSTAQSRTLHRPS